MGDTVECKISKLSTRILKAFYTELSISIIYAILAVILPLSRTPKVLFHQASYPFDLTKPSGYTIAYCIQSYMTFYVNVSVICAYDLIYEAICVNCATQFRLLCVALEYIGTGKEKEILEKIEDLAGGKKKRNCIRDEKINEELLIVCVKHHQRLIK